jgi:hypothetical protein
MDYVAGNSKGQGINGNVGPCRGGGKEGGPAAFIGGEARLVVTSGLMATL